MAARVNMDVRMDRRKTYHGNRRAFPLLAAAIAAVCLGHGVGVANPLGPQVVNGQASFAQQGNTLAITNTPNAIINWQSFSINPGEITRFIQQNPTAASS
jgi:hypothetical protein